MNLDENDFARIFNRLDVDDASHSEHKDALRKHVLAEFDRHAESAVHFRLEPGEMNLETGARLLAFFGLGAVLTAPKEDRRRGESRLAKDSITDMGRTEKILAGERLLGFFGLPVAS
jgi:hypothetical protein